MCVIECCIAFNTVETKTCCMSAFEWVNVEINIQFQGNNVINLDTATQRCHLMWLNSNILLCLKIAANTAKGGQMNTFLWHKKMSSEPLDYPSANLKGSITSIYFSFFLCQGAHVFL